jgi:hypothetical protein
LKSGLRLMNHKVFLGADRKESKDKMVVFKEVAQNSPTRTRFKLGSIMRIILVLSAYLVIQLIMGCRDTPTAPGNKLQPRVQINKFLKYDTASFINAGWQIDAGDYDPRWISWSITVKDDAGNEYISMKQDSLSGYGPNLTTGMDIPNTSIHSDTIIPISFSITFSYKGSILKRYDLKSFIVCVSPHFKDGFDLDTVMYGMDSKIVANNYDVITNSNCNYELQNDAGMQFKYDLSFFRFNETMEYHAGFYLIERVFDGADQLITESNNFSTLENYFNSDSLPDNSFFSPGVCLDEKTINQHPGPFKFQSLVVYGKRYRKIEFSSNK